MTILAWSSVVVVFFVQNINENIYITFTDLTSKIFGKNCMCTEHVQIFHMPFFPKQYSMTTWHIDMIWSVRQDVLTLYANAALFYIRDLSSPTVMPTWEPKTSLLQMQRNDCHHHWNDVVLLVLVPAQRITLRPRSLRLIYPQNKVQNDVSVYKLKPYLSY